MILALCQINPTVGDLAGNADLVLRYARQAADAGAELAVFPELCLTGYPPQDLLERADFLADADAALEHVARHAPAGLGILLGTPRANPERAGKRLRNCAVLLDGGRIAAEVAKTLLPTYDVFDELRHFEPARSCAPAEFRGLRLGVHVCEDLWNNLEDGAPATPLYDANPIDALGEAGVDVFVNLSASPYTAGKANERRGLIAASAKEWGVPFVYVNQVGANTELIFDGDSQVQTAAGRVVRRAPDFAEALLLWDTAAPDAPGPVADVPERIAGMHDALVLGVRDYVQKSGGAAVFPTALVGLSGGIDSAVTCALAVAALGAERVVGVTLPSKYSSGGSVSDSRALANALGIAFHHVSIAPAVAAFETMLADVLGGPPHGVTEENLQSRARGVALMGLSNAQGHLLLTTGNKSEMAVGYATLYGDMSGGLAVLSDVFKGDVYALAREVNRRAGRFVIPEATITKPPSAELRPGQQDSDSLPPYDVLDEVLRRFVEQREGVEAIVAATGFERALVARVAQMVERNEYKRRQAAPGLRVSGKAFGVGRRLPVVMRRTAVDAAVKT